MCISERIYIKWRERERERKNKRGRQWFGVFNAYMFVCKVSVWVRARARFGLAKSLCFVSECGSVDDDDDDDMMIGGLNGHCVCVYIALPIVVYTYKEKGNSYFVLVLLLLFGDTGDAVVECYLLCRMRHIEAKRTHYYMHQATTTTKAMFQCWGFTFISIYI